VIGHVINSSCEALHMNGYIVQRTRSKAVNVAHYATHCISDERGSCQIKYGGFFKMTPALR
jgi:hypothetical protein